MPSSTKNKQRSKKSASSHPRENLATRGISSSKKSQRYATICISAISICSLVWVAIILQKSRATKNEVNFIVAGYLPEYRNYIDLDAASEHLTDLVLFSISPEPDGLVGKSTCCLDASHFMKARASRDHKRRTAEGSKGGNDDLRIMISVGGGGRSNSFPAIAGNERRRAKFVTELIALCKRESLNGVDFDWEQPRTQEEFISYVHLLLEASVAFHNVGLMVSVALHPKQFLSKQAYAQVDRVHLMTYDMINRGAGTDFHHARYSDTVQEVEALIASGCSAEKILMGIPLYARHKQNPGMVKTYSEIVDDYHKKTPLPDESALRSMRVFDGYAFDAPIDVEKKVKYAHESGLGGVFFWEIGQDFLNEKLAPGGILLQSTTRALNDIQKVIQSEL